MPVPVTYHDSSPQTNIVSTETLKAHVDRSIRTTQHTDSIIPQNALGLYIPPSNHPGQLPEHVLKNIFRLLVDDIEIPDSEYPHRMLWLAEVCRHWRAVALDSPECWSRIDLGYPSLVVPFLMRSNGHTLDIVYESRDPISALKTDSMVLTCLELHRERIASLRIRCGNAADVAAVILGLVGFNSSQRPPLTQIRRLELIRPFAVHTAVLETPPVPNLEVLRLYSVSLDWSTFAPKGTLKHIELDRQHPDYPLPLRILVNNVNLEVVRLRCTVAPVVEEAGWENVHLEKCRELTMAKSYHRTSTKHPLQFPTLVPETANFYYAQFFPKSEDLCVFLDSLFPQSRNGNGMAQMYAVERLSIDYDNKRNRLRICARTKERPGHGTKTKPETFIYLDASMDDLFRGEEDFWIALGRIVIKPSRRVLLITG
ncbi:hypothetical protein K474DRAFT_1217657 [Panus rudis PR-1116 ss-1]|nr:hypothetical protein K474DRAFT_1217657 [Panus rudis PR-1116 ss-1]